MSAGKFALSVLCVWEEGIQDTNMHGRYTRYIDNSQYTQAISLHAKDYIAVTAIRFACKAKCWLAGTLIAVPKSFPPPLWCAV